MDHNRRKIEPQPLRLFEIMLCPLKHFVSGGSAYLLPQIFEIDLESHCRRHSRTGFGIRFLKYEFEEVKRPDQESRIRRYYLEEGLIWNLKAEVDSEAMIV